MGCSYVTKNQQIKSKDIDLSCDIIKPNIRETIETNNFTSKIMSDISPIKNSICKENNHYLLDKDMNINQSKKSVNNIKKQNFSGPIISMLKRQVDNYKKNENKVKNGPL